MFNIPATFGAVITELREYRGLSKSQLAEKFNIDEDIIDQIESGELPSISDAEDILNKIGVEDLNSLEKFTNQNYEILPRPPFYHPDRDALYLAELTLRKIRDFRHQQKEPPRLLDQRAEMLEKRLKETLSDHLYPLNYSIAYIGQIGVGKTTAICQQYGLISEETDKFLLETGGGGTTICEVRIKQGNQYSIYVESIEQKEIYELSKSLCASFSQNLPQNQSQGVSKEIERALRNMAKVIKPKPPKSPKSPKSSKSTSQQLHNNNNITQKPIEDPLKQLAESSGNFEKLCGEFIEKLSLWKRTQTEIFYDESDKISGWKWLQTNFKNINNGRDERFSLPKLITITVPNDALNISTIYKFEIIDTKGIDQTVIRPDLQNCINDSKTLIILCSPFNTAPCPLAVQKIISELNETGRSNALKERVNILVLPRTGEAINMRSDDGEQTEDDDDGYRMKSEQIELALRRINTNHIPPIHFFNYSSDDPDDFNEFIIDNLLKFRQKKIDIINETDSDIDSLIQNQEEEYYRASWEQVTRRIENFIERHSELPHDNWRIEQDLLSAIVETHPRTLWASMRRRGEEYLYVYDLLNNSARKEAVKCTNNILNRLDELVQDMLGDNELQPVHQFLRGLNVFIDLGRNNFLNAVEIITSQVFRDELYNDDCIWDECCGLWGQGRGFRDRIKEKFYYWFTNYDHIYLYDNLKSAINNSWKNKFLNELQKKVELFQE